MVVTKKSWRDVLPVHPAADLFPMMNKEELLALGEDIKKNGLHTWPVLWEAEKGATLYLLDGRNRFDAMEAVGLSALDAEGTWLDLGIGSRCRRCSPSDDPYATVLSLNIHRRHLTVEQKRDLIAKLLKATPSKSNRQIAKQVKADHKTVASVRTEKEATGEIPQLDKTIGEDGKARKQPAAKKKRRDVDDYLADKRAKKITPIESTERQFAVLTDLWRMNNTLRAAWERSNLKAQRRFVQWLDGGGLIDEDEVGGAA